VSRVEAEVRAEKGVKQGKSGGERGREGEIVARA
jgi:hypothetical protein